MVGISLVSGKVAVQTNTASTVKFLCSYGGKILPRHSDGKLRYVGGETRVLAVDRSITFSELLLKLGELYGSSVSLRCQLPTEDLDALVSITSNEDLANLIEEYDRANMNKAKSPSSIHPLKMRAFLLPLKSVKKISPPQSASSSVVDATALKLSSTIIGSHSFLPHMSPNRCFRQISSPVEFPPCFNKSAGKLRFNVYHAQPNPSHMYVVLNGNH